jgi:hypothetical protein
MNTQKEDNLKKRILDEMTVSYSSALEKNFELAKQFIRITNDGRVDVLIKDKLTGTEEILLYLVGKVYAKEAGLTPTDEVGNKELMNELGVPSGSLLPWLKELRDNNKIKTITRGKLAYHTVSLNVLERTLKSIQKKISKAA